MRHDPERHHRRSIRLKGFDYSTPGLYVATVCIQHRRPLLGEIVDGEMRPTPAASMVQTTWNEIPWAYPGVEIDAFVVMPNHIHGIIYLLPDEIEFDPNSTWGSGHLGHRRARENGQTQGQGQTQGSAPTENPAVDPGNTPYAHANTGNPAAGVGADPRVCPSPRPTGSPDDERSPTAFESTTGGGDADGPGHGEPGQTQGSAPTDEEGSGAPRLSVPDVVKRFKSLTTHRYGEGVQNFGWEPYRGRLWQRNYYETIVRSEGDLERFRRYIAENPIRWANDRHNPDNPEIL